jgi:hypothetical protein
MDDKFGFDVKTNIQIPWCASSLLPMLAGTEYGGVSKRLDFNSMELALHLELLR